MFCRAPLYVVVYWKKRFVNFKRKFFHLYTKIGMFAGFLRNLEAVAGRVDLKRSFWPFLIRKSEKISGTGVKMLLNAQNLH